MLKKHCCIIVLLAGLLLLPVHAGMAAEQVEVTLPSFDVTLNGQTTSNSYSKYPILVYEDITYFPMTYYDCRLLGLKTDWSEEAGLKIDKNNDYFYEYARDVTESKNANKQAAMMVTGPITVNGQVIDNSQEPYPLLAFRNVTYFPLTWRFAVEAFGWQYSFDAEKGLVISNDQVKMENPVAWQGQVNDYAGGMSGADALRFPVRFMQKQQTLSLSNGDKSQLANSSITLYNQSAEDVVILPTEQWEYQIYRYIGDEKELLYWLKIPFYAGELPGFNGAFNRFHVPFWEDALTAEGDYLVKMVPSGPIPYKNKNTDTVLTAPIEEAPLTSPYTAADSTVTFYLEGIVTISE